MSIDLGAGADKLSLANVANAGTVKNIEQLIGSSGADTITLGSVAQNASIDLAGGNDTLTFGAFNNIATVSNVETVTGGTGADTITLGSPLTTSTSIDLGAGSDQLTLGGGGNTGTVKNVETVIGGSGADVVTIGTALVNGSVDLAGGSDTLQLGNLTNRVSVTNTETVFGGTGNDTVVLTGSNAALVVGGAGMNFITGNTGADQFVLDQNSAGNTSTILNFSAAKGDKIALDTAGNGTLSGNAYNLGGTALIDGTDLKAVADAASRLATVESNGGTAGSFTNKIPASCITAPTASSLVAAL
jgi:Ca2+-binding RTX toxin-like protein